MKLFLKTKTFLSLFVMLSFVESSIGQKIISINAGCTSITVQLEYPEVYTVLTAAECPGDKCCRVTNQTPKLLSPTLFLLKKQANGTFIKQSAQSTWKSICNNNNTTCTTNVTLTGITITAGTYYISVQFPKFATTPDCGQITLTTIATKTNLKLGELDSKKIDSDIVVVGPTLPGDIQYSYIDNTNGHPYGWDVNEDMKINTSASKNYDRWWLAVFEQGGSNKYKSLGWQFGNMPTEIDLKKFWKSDDSNWNFEQGSYYYIQLAGATGCNNSWVEATNPSSSSNSFFVCGNNWGCKIAEDNNKIVISPNPASSSFRLSRLQNIEDYHLTITDLSGRLIKTYSNLSDNEFDISEIQSGLFLVQLWNNSKIISTSKLSIVK